MDFSGLLPFPRKQSTKSAQDIRGKFGAKRRKIRVENSKDLGHFGSATFLT